MQKTSKKKISKKPKKIKNPNDPKRAMNAYFFFLIEQRSELKIKYLDLKSKELVKKVYEAWLKLGISEKEKYQQLANDDKERYLLAKSNKNRNHK